jgi:Fe-S oxidoreductase
MIRLLRLAGVNVGILGVSEACCASPSFTLGDRETFRSVAQKNVEQWQRTGAATLVASCAGCYGLIKSKYPLVADLPFEVLSAPEMIDRLVQDGRLKLSREVRRTVTYHDPCHLGRQSERLTPWHGRQRKVLNQCVLQEPPKKFNRGTFGIYEAPRSLLGAIPGLEFQEMERIREYSFCCASGGGVKSAFPEMALWAATERLAEARATGARALVTSCPWCESNFQDAARAQARTAPWRS